MVYPAIPIGGENGEVRQQPRFGKKVWSQFCVQDHFGDCFVLMLCSTCSLMSFHDLSVFLHVIFHVSNFHGDGDEGV